MAASAEMTKFTHTHRHTRCLLKDVLISRHTGHGVTIRIYFECLRNPLRCLDILEMHLKPIWAPGLNTRASTDDYFHYLLILFPYFISHFQHSFPKAVVT